MRRIAGQTAGTSPTRRRTPPRLGGCGSSNICTWLLLRQSFAGGGASSLNFSGPSPWAAGVDRLRKRNRAGSKAVNSEYAGTDAFIAYCRSCRLVFQLLPGTVITCLPMEGHRGVLLVLSAARSLPRRPFCPLASLTCLLRRGTRKGLRAPYLFLVCKPTSLSEI